MTRLEQLIAELCPDGVEYRPLGEMLINNNAYSSVSKQDYKEEGKLPIIDQSQAYIAAYTDNEAAVPLVYPCIIFGDHTRVIKYAENQFAQGDSGTRVFIPANEAISAKFLYYAFCNLNIPSRGYNRHWTIAKDLSVPLPPLPVQQEIVRILDTFTELTAELKEELQKRREQYRHYSTVIFDDVEESSIYSIKEVCRIEKGKTPIQKAIPGVYPMVVTTNQRKTCDTYQFDAKAVCVPLVSSRGHGVASLNHVYYQEGKFALGNILCAIIPKKENSVLAKYLFYYFEQTKDYTLVPLMKGGANVALHMNDVEKVKVPIPSLDEQERIVSILDRFDTLCNDLSSGLPAEIEARRKQYEYYRDKLLTFKEKSA